MKKVKKSRIAVLVGALLMATVVGVVWARPDGRPRAAAWVNHTVSAYHCIPLRDTVDWKYDPEGLRCDSGWCEFYCPIRPPHEGSVRIQRLIMYAYDNAGGQVCIMLREHQTTTGNSVVRLDTRCTTNSANDPETYMYDHDNFTVSRKEDVYVQVGIADTGQRVYGFKVRYVPL